MIWDGFRISHNVSDNVSHNVSQILITNKRPRPTDVNLAKSRLCLYQLEELSEHLVRFFHFLFTYLLIYLISNADTQK